MNDFLQSLRNGQAEKQRTPKTRKNYDNSYQYSSSSRYHSYGGYPNNRNQHMKRQPAQQPAGNQMSMDDNATSAMLTEAIETLNNHIETLAKNQDYLIGVQERTADMLERQTIAIEKIVDHLNISSGNKTEPVKTPDAKRPFKNRYISSQKPEIEPKAEIKPESAPIKPAKRSVKPVKPVKAIIRKRKKIAAKKSKPVLSTNKKLLSREKIMNLIQSMRAEGATFDQVASRLVELGQPTFSGRGEWHAQTIHRLCNKK